MSLRAQRSNLDYLDAEEIPGDEIAAAPGGASQ
jgi:hypothetical protein